MRVKIIGAGSIGNHMAEASRRMGWEVAIVDSDHKALERTRSDIYPKRYGAWDSAIQLFETGKEPKGGFDIVVIGTPPDSHMRLALSSLLEDRPRLLHIEKPLCTPDLAGVSEFTSARQRFGEIMVTVGYDHAVAESVEYVSELVRQGTFGKIVTMDVEFREHWRGIFSAHPWLAGPWDSYLGHWRRGGGAGGEHSHALHLWLFFARTLGWGRVTMLKGMFDMQEERGGEYDRLAAFLLKTDRGGMGRVVGEVGTYPVRKWARLQGERGFVEWHCNGVPEGDSIKYQVEGAAPVEKIFPKKRPDDFYRVTLHYAKLLAGEIKFDESPLAYARGHEVMEVLNGVYPVV